MLKIYIYTGFIMFFAGAAIIVTISKEWGGTLAIFGWLLAALSMGFQILFSTQEPYVLMHRLMGTFWLATVIYNTPELFETKGLLSDMAIYIPYILIFATCAHIKLLRKT